MAINFPDSPSINDTFIVDNKVWIWTGDTWDSYPTTSPGVPSGGTAGQVLSKSSNTDYDTAWVTASNNQILTGTGTDFSSTQTITLSEGVYRANKLVGYSDYSLEGYDKTSGVPFYATSGDELSVTFKTTADNFTEVADISSVYSSGISKITYGNGVYVGAIGANVVTSTDLVNWTLRTTGLTYSITDIAFNGSVFVALSTFASPYKSAVSSDGISWSTYTFPAQNYSHIISVDGVFKALNGFYSNSMYTSSDGITWTSVSTNLPSTQQYYTFTYLNGKYIVGVSNGLYFSSDGVSYTAVTGVNSPIYSVAYGNGRWMFGGQNGYIATTTDGVTATVLASSIYDMSVGSSVGNISNIEYLDGYFYGFSSNNTIPYLTLIKPDATGYSFSTVNTGYVNDVMVTGSSVSTFGAKIYTSNGVLPPSSSKALLEYISTT